MYDNINQNENENEVKKSDLNEQGNSFYGSGSYSLPERSHYEAAGSNNSAAAAVDTAAAAAGAADVQAVIKPVKKKRRAGRVLGFVAGAIALGIIAGGTFFGVNYALNTAFPKESEPKSYYQVPVSVAVGSNDTGNSGLVMDAADVAEAVMPAIVAVTSKMTQEMYYYGFFSMGVKEYESSGSGIVVGQSDSEILIVTNNHVIDGNNGVMVTFIDNSVVPAVVKGAVAEQDIAVLAVALSDIDEPTLQQIRVAQLGNSDTVRLGERVIAIGNALGFGQSVTQGGISAIGRTITVDDTTFENMLQTDAAINSGNSGGALINTKGEVIGINSAKCSSTGVEGIGYAIPVSSVVDIINELMNRETRTLVDEADRGYLGIGGYAVDSDAQKRYGTPAGISVQHVEEGSAAEKAGIQQFDIITKFDGQKVSSPEELKDMLRYYKAGETVKVTIAYMENRQYIEQEIEVTLDRASQDSK